MDIKHCFSGNRIVVALTAFALTAGTAALARQTTAPSSSTASTQSSTTTTTTTTKKSTKAERKAARKERHEKMANELGLTADQKTQMKAIQQDQRKQMKAVKDDSSLSQDQKAAKFKEIHKAGMEKRDALLTPEQRDKMQHLRDEHEAEEAKEGKEGGHKWHHKKQQTTPSTTETPKS
jgi:Spy/CpxP family protein refolding chaperone